MESRKRAPHSKSINKDQDGPPALPDRRELVEDIMRNRLYASKEVSVLLDISYQTLRRSIAKGSIKTVRVGRFVRIPAEEVMRLMKGETTLLTVQEVAAILQVSTFTVRALIKAGKIDAFRLANQGPFRIRESEMKRIAQEGITK